MTRELRKSMTTVVMVLACLFTLATATGCDELLAWGGGLGLLGGSYYYPTYDVGGYDGFPEYGLYDPTADIQSVVQYQQDAMEASNEGWSEYILQ